MNFDMSHTIHYLHEQIGIVADELSRPCVVLRPRISVDGNQWFVLLGDDLATGLAGFGDTLAKAMADFDRSFYQQRVGTERSEKIKDAAVAAFEDHDNQVTRLRAAFEAGWFADQKWDLTTEQRGPWTFTEAESDDIGGTKEQIDAAFAAWHAKESK